MTLAIHRLLNTVQRSASQAAVGAAVTADKGRTVFYLSKASTVVNILRFSIAIPLPYLHRPVTDICIANFEDLRPSEYASNNI